MTIDEGYTVEATPAFWGRCLFAESFRLEMDGQYSLVGCYMGGIQVRELPATLPKLAFFIEAAANPFAGISEVTFRAFMPGAAPDDHFWEAHQTLDDPDPSARDLAPVGPYPGQPVTRLFTVVNHVLLPVPRAGDIRVRAFVGRSVYPLGSISIIAEPEDAVPDPAA